MKLEFKQTAKGCTISSKKMIVVYLSGNVPGVRGQPVIGFMSKHKLIIQEFSGENSRFTTKKPVKFFANEAEARNWADSYLQELSIITD